MKKLLLFSAILLIYACRDQPEKMTPEEKIMTAPDGGNGKGATSPTMQFPTDIEKAHHKTKFLEHKAIQFDINLQFGGKERLNAKITTLTNSGKIKIKKKDSSSLSFDGKKAWIYPASQNYNGARFDMFTWQYFFALPFKLTDNGTRWEMPEQRILDSTKAISARLTFGDDIGDAPDDWYIIYQSEDKKLAAAAYIVTLNKEVQRAEANPHAIKYHNYRMVDGVPFATKWTFHNWSKENGIEDEIGEAKISNIEFINTDSNFFQAMQKAGEIKK